MRKAWPLLATCLLAVLGIVLIERQPFMAGARFFECLLVLLLLAVAARTTAGSLRNVLVVSCSLVFGLAAIEGVILVLDSLAKTAPPGPVADDSGLAQQRPLVGWGPVKPGVYRSLKSAADGRLIFDTHVTIDDHLNRKTVPSDGPRPIVFFGDSWIYGDGVEDGGTLPQAFADLNHGRIPVLNLSFAGWSPAQNLIALQKGLYASLIQAPRHFILFTATFHVERTACKASYAISQAPRFVLDGDAVRYAGPCGAGANLMAPLLRIARRFALYARIAPMFAVPRHADIDTYIKIIETFVATAKRDYGVETTVLFAPFEDAYIRGSGYTEAQILDKLRGAGIDVLVDKLQNVSDDRYWIKGDGHPTALSNQARAEEIETHLRAVDPAALDTAAVAPAR